jgi:NAD(P)-dependent dehydrogenase (short-subunit alcohol dehydrogenase family)
VRKIVEAASVEVVSPSGVISEKAFFGKLISKSVSELGGINILVNATGKQTSVGTIADPSTQQFKPIYRTNVFARF